MKVSKQIKNNHMCHKTKQVNQSTNEKISYVGSHPRMKISVMTDISVFRFYGYIGDISVDILEKNIGKLKIVKNL